MQDNLESRLWWGHVEEDLKDLFRESMLLVEMSGRKEHTFKDYSFVVFPAAKAYEGFLKKIFFDRGFITAEDFWGKRFRIGKALNPSLDKQYRFESVYDRIVAHCGGRELADKLWETWKESRNMVFHWFPKEKNALTLEEAIVRINMIMDAMDLTVKECKLK
jgi:hypothetical protein